MGKADIQKNRFEKEAQEMRRMLQSIPDPYDVDGHLRPDITANKLAYLFIKHSRRLNRLTATLIALTVILALITIYDIIVRVFPN